MNTKSKARCRKPELQELVFRACLKPRISERQKKILKIHLRECSYCLSLVRELKAEIDSYWKNGSIGSLLQTAVYCGLQFMYRKRPQKPRKKRKN